MFSVKVLVKNAKRPPQCSLASAAGGTYWSVLLVRSSSVRVMLIHIDLFRKCVWIRAPIGISSGAPWAG